jgi:hypothetical protein
MRVVQQKIADVRARSAVRRSVAASASDAPINPLRGLKQFAVDANASDSREGIAKGLPDLTDDRRDRDRIDAVVRLCRPRPSSPRSAGECLRG